jgi:hypothetical protein
MKYQLTNHQKYSINYKSTKKEKLMFPLIITTIQNCHLMRFNLFKFQLISQIFNKMRMRSTKIKNKDKYN